MHSCCASPSFHVPGNKQNQRQVYGKQVCIFQEGGHFWQSIRTSGLRRLAALERPVSKDPVTETATRIQQSKTTEQNHIQMIQMDGSVLHTRRVQETWSICHLGSVASHGQFQSFMRLL